MGARSALRGFRLRRYPVRSRCVASAPRSADAPGHSASRVARRGCRLRYDRGVRGLQHRPFGLEQETECGASASIHHESDQSGVWLCPRPDAHRSFPLAVGNQGGMHHDQRVDERGSECGKGVHGGPPRGRRVRPTRRRTARQEGISCERGHRRRNALGGCARLQSATVGDCDIAHGQPDASFAYFPGCAGQWRSIGGNRPPPLR